MNDAAMRQGRRLELDKHPAPPAGAEVHATGMYHEVQPGDSPIAIAREYSQAFHMDITQAQLTRANATAFADGLHPGELLKVPGLEDRQDSMFLADNPDLQQRGTTPVLKHVVAAGQTLSSIARHYRETEGLHVTWQSIYHANEAQIGANPGRIRPGQALKIPGVTTSSPHALLQPMADLDQQVLLTRTLRVQHESGDVATIDTTSYAVDGAHAHRIGTSVDDAVTAARRALAGGAPQSDVMTVVQASDGAYWTVPMKGRENSNDLDDSDRPLSLAFRADDRAVAAVITRDFANATTQVRRFDQ